MAEDHGGGHDEEQGLHPPLPPSGPSGGSPRGRPQPAENRCRLLVRRFRDQKGDDREVEQEGQRLWGEVVLLHPVDQGEDEDAAPGDPVAAGQSAPEDEHRGNEQDVDDRRVERQDTCHGVRSRPGTEGCEGGEESGPAEPGVEPLDRTAEVVDGVDESDVDVSGTHDRSAVGDGDERGDLDHERGSGQCQLQVWWAHRIPPP